MADEQQKRRFWVQFIREGIPWRFFLGLMLIGVGLWILWVAVFEEPRFLWRYLIVPIYMFVLGVRQIYLAYREFFYGIVPGTEVGPDGRVKTSEIFWKWATRVGLLFAFAFGFWVVVFFGLFFIFLPYMLIQAVRRVVSQLRRELLKTQKKAETAEGAGKIRGGRRLRFTFGEWVIICIGAAAFIAGEILWLINSFSDRQTDEELFTVIGVILSTFWLLGFTAALTFGCIGALRGLKAEMRKRRDPQYVAAESRRPFVFKALCVLAGILLFVGFTSFMSGFVFSAIIVPGKPVVSGRWCFPIAEPEGIAVDDEHIVVRSTFYERIQVYDREGNFQKGWFCPKVKGAHLLIDEQGRIQLAGYENEWFFDFEGNLLSKVSKEYDFDGFQERFGVYKDWVTEDRQSNTYRISHPHLWPQLHRIDSNGVETILISTPWYLWFLNGPAPSWLTGAAGMMFAIGLSTLDKWRQIRPDLRGFTPVRVEQARLGGQ
jgi:hypothetical protein